MKKRMFSGLMLASLACALALAASLAFPDVNVRAAGKIIYVDHTATGFENGGTWHSAYTNLQDGLTAANAGDQVWVARGVYYPGESGLRQATFNLKDGVAVYGGFAGGETALEQRDWVANVTVLSGDIDQNDVTDAEGVVHSWEDVKGENAYNVVTALDIGPDTVLDGFVITGGNANSDYYRSGGGMYIEGGSNPALRNLIISGNYAFRSGGGVYVKNNWLTMDGIILRGNESYYGGGMYLDTGSSGTPILTNVIFYGNKGGYGGGLYHDSTSTHMENVIFSGNHGWHGGGIYTQGYSLKLFNVTFSGNTGYSVGGLDASCNFIEIHNTILWGNHATKPDGRNDLRTSQFGQQEIFNSLIRGSNGSGPNWNTYMGIDGGGNLDADPHFINPIDPADAPTTDGDYRLRFTSPAVDAGDSTVVTTTTDLDGSPRITGSAVDLGAYEWQGVRETITPAEGGQLVHTNAAHGFTTTIDIPQDAVKGTITLVFTDLGQPLLGYPGKMFAGLAFDLEVLVGSTVTPGFAFEKPVTFTVDYGGSATAVKLEESLTLHFLDQASATWQDVSTTCDPPSVYDHDLDAKTLSVDVCHLTHFGLFGEGGYETYLPLILR
jgi:hypothetical protein